MDCKMSKEGLVIGSCPMFIRDLLFPRACLICGYLGAYICLDCERNLKRLKKDHCFYCGRESYLGLTHPGCKRDNGLDGKISVFIYEDKLKKIVKQIKYRLVREATKELFFLMGEKGINHLKKLVRLEKGLVFQPIPLYPAKLKERGFNQSLLLANFLNYFLNIELVDILKRTKNTRAQAQLKAKAMRRENVQGAFVLARPGQKIPKKIILIDDVLTSGFTVKEAAKVLKQQGVEKVYVFTLAQG